MPCAHRFLCCIAALCISFSSIQSSAQQLPVAKFYPVGFDSTLISKLSNKKKIPERILPQALTALSYYPELKDAKIIFRLKKRKTPLTSRPRIFGIFRKKGKRTYVITISTKTTSTLAPILFDTLPYNAQIGVLGHELAHIPYYQEKTGWQIFRLAFKLSDKAFVDLFEFETDKRTIAHGLGYQLLDWSIFVRKALGITVWRGADEAILKGSEEEVSQRYMNPETIKRYMAADEKYQEK